MKFIVIYMSPNDDIGYDELVKYDSGVKIQYHGVTLAPSDKYLQFWSSIPKKYRSDLDIIRLGIVSHQLYEFENELEIESEADQSCFSDFAVSSHHKQETVTEFAVDIRSNIGSDGKLIINRSSYPVEVTEAVDEFLESVCDELDGDWGGVVKQFCKESGLSCDDDETTISTSSTTSNSTNLQSVEHSEDAVIVSNEHYL